MFNFKINAKFYVLLTGYEYYNIFLIFTFFGAIVQTHKHTKKLNQK